MFQTKLIPSFNFGDSHVATTSTLISDNYVPYYVGFNNYRVQVFVWSGNIILGAFIHTCKRIMPVVLQIRTSIVNYLQFVSSISFILIPFNSFRSC